MTEEHWTLRSESGDDHVAATFHCAKHLEHIRVSVRPIAQKMSIFPERSIAEDYRTQRLDYSYMAGIVTLGLFILSFGILLISAAVR